MQNILSILTTKTGSVILKSFIVLTGIFAGATSPETATNTTVTATTTINNTKLNFLKVTATQYSPYIKKETKPILNTQTTIDSVVNIFCQEKTDKQIKTYTGSGVIINNQGKLLTNAHVIKPLIDGKNVKCQVRYGDTAKGSIPILGIYKNQNGQTSFNTGYDTRTGENDIVILKINNSGYQIKTKPSSDPVYLNQQISITAYPSETVYKTTGSNGITNNLIKRTEYAHITNLYRFDRLPIDQMFLNTQSEYTDIIDKLAISLNPNSIKWPDLALTSATNIAESGSSGGGVFNSKGELIGVIANIVNDNGKTVLRFLTYKYIRDNFLNNYSVFQVF